MRKNILLLFLISIMFIFPVSVKAENKIYFENDTVNVAPGETKKVNIIVDSDASYTGINMSMITTSSYISFYSVDFSDDFKRDVSGSIYKLVSDKPIKSGTVIGSVTVKAKETATEGVSGYIRISNASLVSESTIPLYNAQLKVVVSDEKSSNNYLSNITSNIVDLKFSKDKLKYSVEVENDVEELDLVALKEDSSSTVTISDQKLKVGKNEIKVTVTSETGEERVYEITVNRKDNEVKNVVSDQKKDNINNKEKSNEGKASWVLMLFLLVVALFLDIIYIKFKKQK